MARTFSHSLSVCLIGGGALVWALAGRPILQDRELLTPLNPLGINRSPYGEVFAMAMQGTIETYYHGAIAGGAHAHAEGEECAVCAKKSALASSGPITQRFQSFLSSMGSAHAERTNPKPPSPGLRMFLRRQAEDKLRFAYNLDPSHYGNYNSLHFFLTEPQMGTRPILTPAVAKLAEDTIRYCWSQQDDPRPILTAAAACNNMLLLMFDDAKSAHPKFTTAQMNAYLAQLDQCLDRYELEASKWNETKQWDLLSPQRVKELQERYDFILQIRDAARKTVPRIETEQREANAANPSPSEN